MSVLPTPLRALFATLVLSSVARAQDLVPGAYVPAPVGYNLVSVASNFNSGDFAFDPSLPIEKGHATIGGPAWGSAAR